MSGDYSDRYTSRVDLSYLEAPEFLGKTAVSGVDAHRLHGATTARPAPRRTSIELQNLWDHLSDRDHELLAALEKYRLVTTDQLQRQILTAHSSVDSARRITRRCLSRLANHGLIRTLGRRIGGIKAGSTGMVWTLTPHGYRILGHPKRKRLAEPSLTHIRHVLAIAELATDLTETANQNNLELSIEAEPVCWRTITDTQPPLKPDLHVRIADATTELSWFIEIDHGTESGTVIARKLKRYDTYWRSGTEQTLHGVFPRVAWIASDADRANFIDRHTHHRAINHELFTTVTPPEAIALLSDFGLPDDGSGKGPA